MKKIVINIPNWLYEVIMECKESNYSKSLGEAVRDGTPLNEVLDKIRAEIASYGTNSGMLLALEIIDKHRGEAE